MHMEMKEENNSCVAPGRRLIICSTSTWHQPDVACATHCGGMNVHNWLVRKSEFTALFRWVPDTVLDNSIDSCSQIDRPPWKNTHRGAQAQTWRRRFA